MKKILFQGDSITDVKRDRENDNFLGSGYSTIVAGRLAVDYPGEFQIVNRGISGKRIVDLYARVKKDFINLKPDIASILIGINGVWHEISAQNGVSAVKYEMIYNIMMSELKTALPNTKFIILEPFVLCGSATGPSEENPKRWDVFKRETALRADAARRIAGKYNAVFVPLQHAFDEACKKAPSDYWLVDGVHPTVFGHGLIAQEWIKYSELIINNKLLI